MIYLFLADGFEEIEALTPVDMLRRAGADIKTVAVKGRSATGSHNIEVICDISVDEIKLDGSLEAVILPGGMPGTLNLEKSDKVIEAVEYCVNNNKTVAAICAAPSILGHLGLLRGREAICFPGFEKDLTGAKISEKAVCSDGNIITAKSMGYAVEFAEALISELVNPEKAKEISESIH